VEKQKEHAKQEGPEEESDVEASATQGKLKEGETSWKVHLQLVQAPYGVDSPQTF
jgi:hypothetical protein